MHEVSRIGGGIWISDQAILGKNVAIGHGSCVGYGDDETQQVWIMDNVSIGAFCVIHLNSTIHSNVEIDHYCRIGSGVTIGPGSKILYGTQVFNNALVGRNCIIGGDLSERVVVEDNVTFMGSIAHSHRNPNLDWDTTDEPSPVFRKGSVIGVDALIVGGISIGPFSYVAAGEKVNFDVPPRKVIYKNEMTDLDYWRGIIKVRDQEP